MDQKKSLIRCGCELIKRVTCRLASSEELQPPQECCERAALFRSEIVLTEQQDSSVAVDFYMEVDFGLSFPKWVTAKFMKPALWQTMRRLDDRCKQVSSRPARLAPSSAPEHASRAAPTQAAAGKLPATEALAADLGGGNVHGRTRAAPDLLA